MWLQCVTAFTWCLTPKWCRRKKLVFDTKLGTILKKILVPDTKNHL